MKLLLSLFIIFSFVEVSWGQVLQRQKQFDDGHAEIRLLYSEKGLYFVDTIRVEKDGWQDRTEQKTFSIASEAHEYFLQHTLGYATKMKISSMAKPSAKVAIWKVSNQWSAEWEAIYSDWINTQFNENFFVKYQIPTDCADVAFAVRWIFARIHGLPAAVSLAGTDRLFTQSDGKPSWASLPTASDWYNDKRFRTALLYVLNNTFTHSLLEDSYPVEINSLAIQPGGYYLTLFQDTGHTRLISRTNPNGAAIDAIRFLSSDVPADVRVLFEEHFALKKFLPKQNGGFLRFRWPRLNSKGRYELVPENEMPGYSLEQYGTDFEKSYYNTVLKHLGVTNKPDEFIRLRLALAWEKLQNRVLVVNQGTQVCSQEDCTPGTANFENWSTPHRDEQIYDLISESLETYWQNTDNSKVVLEYDKWKDLTLDIGGNLGLSPRYEDLMQIWYNHSYTSDPRDSILLRWGF